MCGERSNFNNHSLLSCWDDWTTDTCIYNASLSPVHLSLLFCSPLTSWCLRECVCVCASACVCTHARGVCVCTCVVCVWWVSEWVGGRGEGDGNGRVRKKNHGTTQETSFERERQGWEKGRQGGYFLISGETTRDKGRLPETSRDHWLSTSYELLTWDYY